MLKGELTRRVRRRSGCNFIMMLEKLLWDAMLRQRNAYEGTTEVNAGLSMLHEAECEAE